MAPKRAIIRESIGSGVFFVGGLLTAIVSLVVPRLKLLFGLDYIQAPWVHSALALPALCYCGIVLFGRYCRSPILATTA